VLTIKNSSVNKDIISTIFILKCHWFRSQRSTLLAFQDSIRPTVFDMSYEKQIKLENRFDSRKISPSATEIASHSNISIAS